MTTQELIDYIVERYQFTPDKFPKVEGMSEEEKFHFAIKHLALHFAKTAGKIVTVSEEYDHSGKIDFQNLKVDVAKSMLNTLRMAELAKVSGDELVAMVKGYVK